MLRMIVVLVWFFTCYAAGEVAVHFAVVSPYRGGWFAAGAAGIGYMSIVTQKPRSRD